MKPTPTVYITNRSGHDFEPAKKFGQIKFLSEGDVDPFNVNRIYCNLAVTLQHSNPCDFLLITGLSVMNSISSAIMARKHGRVNWLQYHAGTKTYSARTIVLDRELIGDIVGEVI